MGEYNSGMLPPRGPTGREGVYLLRRWLQFLSSYCLNRDSRDEGLAAMGLAVLILGFPLGSHPGHPSIPEIQVRTISQGQPPTGKHPGNNREIAA